jgi:uncharacterized protein (DUF488 family)
MTGEKASVTIWTIGHSSVEARELFNLLAGQQVDLLVDVRSSPYSRYVPQANRDVLTAAAKVAGVEYLFMGAALGGKPDDPALIRPDGKPDYARIAEGHRFRQGIARLVELARTRRLACMCSEEDPAGCHRGNLIAPTLVSLGHRVLHIRHDGSMESHEQMELRKSGGQLSLF